LKLSNLNSQEKTRTRSFPVLLQPKFQRTTPFSLLGSTQSRPRTFLIQELDFSYVSSTALKPYSERTSVVIDQRWPRFSTTSTSYIDGNSVSPVYQLLDNTSSPESSPVQKHSPIVINKKWSHNTSTPEHDSCRHLD